VKAWQLSRLIDDARLAGPCDSALNSHIKALKSYKTLLISKDSILQEVQISRDTWRVTSEQKDTLATVMNKKHDIQLKDQKTKTRKLTLIAIGQAVIIVLLIL